MADHDDLGFVEDSAPDTSAHDDLGFVADSSPTSPVDSGWTADRLQKEGYLFDNYQKLSPEEKAKYDQGIGKEAGENSAAFGEGLSRGAFTPAEIANKLTPGKSVQNLRQKLIAGTEKGIASLVGDDATQDLYNGMSDDELAAKNTADSNATVQKAPVSAILGNVAGSLPATIAAGGGISKLGQLASAGSEGLTALGIKGVTNVAGNAAIGEALGASNSNADTLGQRLKEGLPAAKQAALTSVPFELAGLATSPEGQALLSKAGGKVKDMANRAAAKSLSLTGSQLNKLDSKGQTGTLGAKLLENGTKEVPLTAADKIAMSEQGIDVDSLGNSYQVPTKSIVTPFASASSKAEKLTALKNKTGASINTTAKDLDTKFQAQLAQTGGDEAKKQVVRDYLSKKNLANAVEKKVLDPIEFKGDPNDLGFKTKSLLSKIQQTGPKAADAVADNAASVASAGEAAPNANTMGQQNSEMEQFIANMDKKIANGERVDLENPESQALVKQIMEKRGTSPVVDEAANFLDNYGVVSEDAGSGIPTSQPVDDTMSIQAINGMKQDVRQGINYNSEGGAVAQNKKDFSRALNDEMLDRSAKAETAIGGDSPLTNKLVQANKDYGAVSTGAKASAANAAKRELAKTAITAGALGGAGYAINGKKGALQGLAAGALTKFGGAYGKNIQATSLDKLASVLKTAPQTLGEYAPVLQNASARGTASLAATNFILSQQSPEYRKMQEGIDTQQDNALPDGDQDITQ